MSHFSALNFFNSEFNLSKDSSLLGYYAMFIRPNIVRSSNLAYLNEFICAILTSQRTVSPLRRPAIEKL